MNLLEVGRAEGVVEMGVEGGVEEEVEGEGERPREEVGDCCALDAFGFGGEVGLGGVPKYPVSTRSSKRTCVSRVGKRS